MIYETLTIKIVGLRNGWVSLMSANSHQYIDIAIAIAILIWRYTTGIGFRFKTNSKKDKHLRKRISDGENNCDWKAMKRILQI